jgi:hypothetical protein
MVVNDFDLVRILATPVETDAILVINPNAVVARPIPLQWLQAVAGEFGYIG